MPPARSGQTRDVSAEKTIRVYCLKRLAETEDEVGVRHRMCSYYLALAETAEPLLRTRAQRRWLEVMAAESSNMIAALRWAIEQGDADTALKCGAALAWFWYLCSQRADSASLAAATLALNAAGQQRADRATAEARAISAVTVATAGWDLEPIMQAVDAAVAAAAADPGGQPPHPIVVIARAQTVNVRAGGEQALQWLAGHLDSADLEAGDTARGMELLSGALGTAATAGNRSAAAAAVEGLATAALRLAAAEQAAALLGAADSIRGAVDHSSLDAPGIRRAAIDQLGEAAFGAAYRRGLGMPYDEALGFAQASTALATERSPME